MFSSFKAGDGEFPFKTLEHPRSPLVIPLSIPPAAPGIGVDILLLLPDFLEFLWASMRINTADPRARHTEDK